VKVIDIIIEVVFIEKDINNLPKYYVFLYLSKAQKGRILVSFDIGIKFI